MEVILKRLYWLFGGASLFIAAVASYLASRAPDGLERAAEDLGLAHKAGPPHAAPLPDYQVPGLGEHWGGGLAGVIGVLAVLALSFALGRILRAKKTAK